MQLEKTMKYKNFEIRSYKEQADIDVINEVFIHDTYKLEFLKLKTPNFVFDIGAHIGSFSRKVASLYPEESIIFECFEADPENQKLLKLNTLNIMENHSKMTVKINGALRIPGFNVMTRSETTTGGGGFRDNVSNNPPSFIRGQVYETIDPTASVDYSYFNISERKGNIWMKLDCEGSEFGILPQIPREELQQIDFLVGEYHISGPAFKRMIMGFFGDTHYFVKKCWVEKTLGDIIGNFWLFKKNVTDIRIVNLLEQHLKT